MWNLKVKGTDVVAYNQRFQELALLCDRMFPEETDKIERYVGGMADLIYSSVCGIEAKNLAEAIEMALNKIRELSLLLKTAETREVLKTLLEITQTTKQKGSTHDKALCRLSEWLKKRLMKGLNLYVTQCEAPATSKRSPWKNRTGNWQRCSHLCSGVAGIKPRQQLVDGTSKHEEASEDNIGVVEERELLCKIFQVQFGFPKLQFLGHVIDNKAFHVDPSISNPLKIGTLLRHQRRFSVLCACWTEARKPEISTRGCWRVGDDCYTSSASEEPEQVHITFHVSNLNKSWQRTLDVPLDGLQFDDSISLSRGTIESQIRSQTVLNKAYHQLSQVRWNFKRGPEFTWEREDQFRKK
ncbi:hypothetical protein Tco_1238928 [Tanacetum coccineum]